MVNMPYYLSYHNHANHYVKSMTTITYHACLSTSYKPSMKSVVSEVRYFRIRSCYIITSYICIQQVDTYNILFIAHHSGLNRELLGLPGTRGNKKKRYEQRRAPISATLAKINFQLPLYHLVKKLYHQGYLSALYEALSEMTTIF